MVLRSIFITGVGAAMIAAAPVPQLQDIDRLEQAVRAFSGRTTPRVDHRLRLAACATDPAIGWYGSQKASVVVECAAPKAWRIFVPTPNESARPVGSEQAAGQAARDGGAVVVARPVIRGSVLTAEDLRIDPGMTAFGGLMSIDQAVGKLASRSLNPGEPLRVSSLSMVPQVKRGDPVQIRAGGEGVLISVDGVAEGDAPTGGRVKVRNLATGSRLQAVVLSAGIVALPGYKNSETGRE